MGSKAEYRSSIRSRESIRAAFLELLETTDLNRITVTAIVERAGINRSTFYAHYPDVRGIVEEIEDETLAKLMTVLDRIESAEFLADPTPLLLKVSRQLGSEQDYYRTLIRASGAAGFLEKLQGTFAERMMSDPAIPAAMREDASYVLRVNYFAGGIVNLYRLWLGGGLDCSVDDISREVGKMVSAASSDLRGDYLAR